MTATPTTTDPHTARAHALLWGLALGDALGWPVEFLSLNQIRARYGREGIQHPPDPALYTDDTQMSLAVTRALIEAGHADLDTLMGRMRHHFIAWKHHPDTPDRAPGLTCMRGVNALELGAPWREAGVKGSKGCGASMRVAPVGYYYQHHPALLKTVARAQGWLTHRHPASEAACVGAAYTVKLALDGAPPTAWLDEVHNFTFGMDEEFAASLRRVAEALPWADTEAALNHIGPTRGGGWTAEEAVAMALYCALKHPDDYVAAVRLAANITGDSDSVACIAGGMVAARLGPAALPADWLNRLENYPMLTALASALAQARANLPQP